MRSSTLRIRTSHPLELQILDCASIIAEILLTFFGDMFNYSHIYIPENNAHCSLQTYFELYLGHSNRKTEKSGTMRDWRERFVKNPCIEMTLQCSIVGSVYPSCALLCEQLKKDEGTIQEYPSFFPISSVEERRVQKGAFYSFTKATVDNFTKPAVQSIICNDLNTNFSETHLNEAYRVSSYCTVLLKRSWTV